MKWTAKSHWRDFVIKVDQIKILMCWQVVVFVAFLAAAQASVVVHQRIGGNFAYR